MNIIQILKAKVNIVYAKYINNNKIEELPIYYIAGSQTLPPPLDSEEEDEALKKLSNGDEDIKKVLVERNLRLVVYIAKKFENTGVGIEDLISIGTIGLMKAINTFNTDKIKGEVSIDEPLNQDGDGNELLLSDILGTEGDITSRRIEDEVDKKLLKESITKLSPREKYIMELRFGFGSDEEKTQKEVADMLGISQSYISRLEKKIISKMRREIKSKTG